MNSDGIPQGRTGRKDACASMLSGAFWQRITRRKRPALKAGYAHVIVRNLGAKKITGMNRRPRCFFLARRCVLASRRSREQRNCRIAFVENHLDCHAQVVSDFAQNSRLLQCKFDARLRRRALQQQRRANPRRSRHSFFFVRSARRRREEPHETQLLVGGRRSRSTWTERLDCITTQDRMG